ncbi:MAG: DUF763 domain-containing protein [Candidatus Caldarchaeum sp.]|uniref:DUF763 domain-containing protein n=1 Tax=Caldiarchaeum subterraneum TaxID=311458 RepID=A0A7C5L758_CALS0
MFRAGVRELRGWSGRSARFHYNKSRQLISEFVNSFLNLHGPDELVAGFAEPFFTDFVIVISGLDEMSGDSTLVMGSILKECLTARSGVAALGGRFTNRFKIPQELPAVASLFGFSEKQAQHLIYCSRMVAKTDSVAIQDGFDLYFHMMMLSHSGIWTVIQQSINPYTLAVRRYHWFSGYLRSFVEEPHTGIISVEKKPRILDMTAKESRQSRKASLDILANDVPKLQRLYTFANIPNQTTLDEEGRKVADFLRPHERISWALVHELEKDIPRDYEALLAVRRVGRGIIRLLAFGVYVLYGVKPSLRDPAITPYEVAKTYSEDHFLWRLQQAVDSVKNSNLPPELKRHSLRRLAEVFGGGEAESIAA